MVKIRVSVKELESMMRIPEDKKEFAEAWIHILTHGFKWNEFILFIKELTQSYKVKINGEGDNQKISIRKNQYDDYGLLTKQTRYEISITEYVEKLKDFILSGSNHSLSELADSYGDFVDIVPPMSFMQYMIVEEKKRTYEYVQPIKTRSTTSKGTKSKQKSVEYTLLDAIKVYQNTSPDGKRKYQKHSTGWEVSGKFRHYKSGKVGWVRPYATGDKRTNHDKEYKLKENNSPT
jgi:hypothetical protein